MFINTLPVRLRIDERGVEAALRQTHETLARLLHHEHAPLALAQRCSGVDAQAPLFTTLFNYRYSVEQAEDGASDAGDSGIEVLHSQDRTNYPITISIDDLGQNFRISTQTIEVFDPERLGQFIVRGIEALMDALDRAPQKALCLIDVLPPSERHQVLIGWNETRQAYDRDATMHALFETQVQRHPEAIALVFE
ncbi:condensation domain-containing protein, partial [Denitromonas iodatirespirans]